MNDPQQKTKIFVLTISVIVIALIITGFVLTWKIVQRGQDNSDSLYEILYISIEPREHQTYSKIENKKWS